MRDRDLRPVLRERLATSHAAEQGAVLLEELGLRCGTARADLVVVNGALKVYEIKSQQDSLIRLENQSSIYSQIFDTVTLVVAERHLRLAQAIIPMWWGIEVATLNSSFVNLEVVRNEAPNPEVNPNSLVQLLWRDEVVAILDQLPASKGFRSKPRRILWEMLTTTLPLDDLKAVVREFLKKRTGWQAVVPQMPSDETFQLFSKSSDSLAPCVRARTRRYTYRPS
jgi:hypothetical protein